MKKLELKHIAPYLPYGLNGKFKLSEASILSKGQKDEIRDKTLTADNVKFFLFYCKPILRPLTTTDLHIYFFENNKMYSSTLTNYIQNVKSGMLNYLDFTHLLEMHFDVFGLIDAGLAIDINTI